MEYLMPVRHWPWQEAVCKMRVGQDPNPDACLWQGCVAEGNLTKGSIDYYYGKQLDKYPDPSEASTCITNGHCENKEFRLPYTSVAEQDAWCDKRYGKSWRHLRNGLQGNGPPAPGSGVWECVHSNFQCDWATCQLFYCPGAPHPPPNPPVEQDKLD